MKICISWDGIDCRSCAPQLRLAHWILKACPYKLWDWRSGLLLWKGNAYEDRVLRKFMKFYAYLILWIHSNLKSCASLNQHNTYKPPVPLFWQHPRRKWAALFISDRYVCVCVCVWKICGKTLSLHSYRLLILLLVEQRSVRALLVNWKIANQVLITELQ